MNIALGAHHDCAELACCSELARDLFKTLSTGDYEWPVSVLPLDDLSAYRASHRTARKRAARSSRLGYSFEPISRADFADDIFAINTSLPERQGRPMSDSYRTTQTFGRLPKYGCTRHRIDEYGVLRADILVAYLVLYTSGNLALISQILGHGDHLENDVMYLLALGAFDATVVRSGSVTVFYNRHDSGTKGLVYFKERLGFQPERVTWSL